MSMQAVLGLVIYDRLPAAPDIGPVHDLVGDLKPSVGWKAMHVDRLTVCGVHELRLGLEEKDFHQLIDSGMRIKQAVMDSLEIKHPFEEDLGFLYGTIFVGKALDPTHHSRNVCIFAEGEVDRSPTGTGVSARAAIHFSRDELVPGQPIVVESILGTSFRVRIVEVVDFDIYRAVIPEVTGSASIIGQSRFYFDPEDPLREGFILR